MIATDQESGTNLTSGLSVSHIALTASAKSCRGYARARKLEGAHDLLNQIHDER